MFFSPPAGSFHVNHLFTVEFRLEWGMVAKQCWMYGRGLTTSIPSLATVDFTGEEEEFPMEHFKDDEVCGRFYG